MTTLDEIAAKIDDQATRKGWSRNLHYMQLGVFKEQGELVQAMEHINDPDPTKRTTRQDVMKEFGDVIYFLFQEMKVFDPTISLDEALEMVYQDNEVKKKKTIDDHGNMVRK